MVTDCSNLSLRRLMFLFVVGSLLACTLLVGHSSPPWVAAETAAVEWVREFGADWDDYVAGIAAGADGVYVAGTIPYYSDGWGYYDFLRKYDVNGAESWTREMTDFGAVAGPTLGAVSAYSGGVYVIGTGFASGSGDCCLGFVRKYDGDGNVAWSTLLGGSRVTAASAVSACSSGIYVAWRELEIGPGEFDLVARYDSDGNSIWTRQFGDYATRIVTISADSSGAYVAGSTGDGDAFVRKYDTAGNVVWTREFGTAYDDTALGVSVGSGGVYVAGRTSGVLPGQTSQGDTDAFVRKYDADGNALWTRQFGGDNYDSAYGISADSTGIHVAGAVSVPLNGFIYRLDPFVIKYDANGNEVWSYQFEIPADEIATEISTYSGAIYAAGTVEAGFPGQTTYGGYDIFLVKMAGNDTPAQPTNLSPFNAATGISLTPTLHSSGFLDPDVGDTHAASQWQIRASTGNYSSPAYDSGITAAHLTDMSVPLGELTHSTTYYWRVRHQDDRGTWSDYSNETRFSTSPGLLTLPFSDDFNDNALNSSLWATVEQGGPTCAEVNQRLEIHIPAASADPPIFSSRGFRAGYSSIAPVAGNYDVQVDFALPNWPAADGIRVGIIMDEYPFEGDDVPEINTIRGSNFGAWTEFYHVGVIGPGQGGTTTATADSTGRLRQVRIGDTVSAYYWNSTVGDWALIDTLSGVTTHDLYVSLWAWSHDYLFGGQAALVVFDNLAVYSANIPPNRPSNVIPANGATTSTTEPTLQSSAFSDSNPDDTHAASQWQVTTTPSDYSTPIFESGVDTTNLTQILLPSGILAGNTTYHWRVRHQDNGGAWSDYSSQTAFTTLNHPPVLPANVSPAGGAEGLTVTPTLTSSTFSDPDAADTHAASQWQIRSTAADYSAPVFDSGVDTSNLTSIAIPSEVLANSTTYYWHVGHQDSHGAWSEWSTETSFTTFSRPPDQPANVSPVAGAADTSRTPTLTSSAFSDPDAPDTHAASQWQVTTTPGDYSSPIFDTGTDTTNLTSVNVPAGLLTYSTIYYWHVRHQDSHLVWSDWSAETSFTTASQPQAEFAVTSVRASGGVMLIFFSNLSTGGALPLTYAWDFDNDGTIDATEREPWHRYMDSGTYTVSLTVTDAVGNTDSETKVNCLTILPPGGGKMETADGQISTDFPDGAVAGTAVVTIESKRGCQLPGAPQGFMIGDTCFVIMALDEEGNEIVTLSQPTTITVKYSEADVAAADGSPENLVLAYWDEDAGEWKPLDTVVNTAEMTLTASTTHLSTWAILVAPASSQPLPAEGTQGIPLWAWVLIGIGVALIAGVIVLKTVSVKVVRDR